VWAVLALLVLALLGVRLYLPIAVRNHLDGVLHRNGAYAGRVADVDLALWRASGEIRGLEIVKRNGKVPVPLVEVPRAHATVLWGALLQRGELVLDATVESPALHLVAAPTKEQQQYGEGGRWEETFDALSPIAVDRLTVTGGRAHFHDFHSDPPVDVYLSDISVSAEHLTEPGDASDPMPDTARVVATPMTAGRLVVTADLDPLARLPHFDVDVELTGMELVPWNDLLRAYADIDVEAGTMALYAEAEADAGSFRGYLKPMVEGLEVHDEEEKKRQSVLRSAWESIVGATAKVLENEPTERVATRVPLAGTVANPEVDFWATFVNALRNAFVEAYAPRLEVLPPEGDG